MCEAVFSGSARRQADTCYVLTAAADVVGAGDVVEEEELAVRVFLAGVIPLLLMKLVS